MQSYPPPAAETSTRNRKNGRQCAICRARLPVGDENFCLKRAHAMGNGRIILWLCDECGGNVEHAIKLMRAS